MARSDDMLRWRLGARTPGADYAVFRTGFVDGAHPETGAAQRFSLIECPDWVNIIALTPDRRVVLLRQHRIGADAVCIEIPGGMIDPGESPAAAAARELREETGYTASTWRRLGVVKANPALQNNHLHTYLAVDAIPGDAALEENEILATETVPLDDALAMIRDGRIDHALVVVAFAHLALDLPRTLW